MVLGPGPNCLDFPLGCQHQGIERITWQISEGSYRSNVPLALVYADSANKKRTPLRKSVG